MARSKVTSPHQIAHTHTLRQIIEMEWIREVKEGFLRPVFITYN